MYAVLHEGRPLRAWAALVTALALHGVAGAIACMFDRTTPAPIESQTLFVAETEIELEAAGASNLGSSEATAAPNPMSETGSGSPVVERRSLTPDGVPSPEPAASASEGGYGLDPSAPARKADDGRRVELGIAPGDWSRWVDPTGPADRPAPPGRTPAPVSSTGGLAEALEMHDREVGLGPAGPVVSAAHEAGHSDVAPAIGTASFAVTVLRTGAL